MEPSNRVYIGSLDPTITQPEMEAEVRPFGNATSVWVARQPSGFAFIEFSTVQEAQACVASLDGVRIGQQNVTVQFAKSKGRKPPPAGSAAPTPAYSGDRPTPGPGPGRKFRAVLKNLPASFTWRELKDEMRLVGDIIYADVDAQGDGIVEFSSEADLDYAIRRLDGSQLDGNVIEVYRPDGNGPPRSAPPPPVPDRPPPSQYDDRAYGRDTRGDYANAPPPPYRYEDRRPRDDGYYGERRARDEGYGHGGYGAPRGGALPPSYDDRRPPQQDERRRGYYDERRRDDRYAAPRRDDRYVEPRRDDRYGEPRRDDRYGEPRRDDRYGEGGDYNGRR